MTTTTPDPELPSGGRPPLTSRPRVLVTLADVAHPTDSGKRQRSAVIVRALAGIADLDVAVLWAERPSGIECMPPDLKVSRVLTMPRLGRPLVPGLTGTVRRRLPWRIGSVDWASVRHRLQPWLAASYDLVVFGTLDHAVGLDDIVPVAPRIVDYDDLESSKIEIYLRGRRSPNEYFECLQRAIELRWWHRLEGQVADRSAAVVVCSDLDRGRLGGPQVAVVPNSYVDPGEPLRPRPAGPPVFLMIGNYAYEPNVDAAVRAVRTIRPLLRSLRPDSVLRFVGRHSREALGALATEPGVEIGGQVDSVGTELSGATAVIAPIGYGGGTRTKIIEAFAYRIPVVSTSLGAEGLGAVNGQEILIADDPHDFAAACARLAGDSELREGIAQGGRALYERRFRQDVAVAAIRQLVDHAMGVTV